MSIGLRIKQARRRRGLALRALAERVGTVSHTTLSKYERGDSTPDSGTLIRIAQALDFDLAFFLRPTLVGDIRPVYRKKDGLKKKEEQQIIEDIRDWLERYLETEKIWGEEPHFSYPKGFPKKVRSFGDVEEAAVALRKAWEIGLDPLEDITGHLEDKGIRVGFLPADDDFDACAFEAEVDGGIPVIVTNRTGPGDRQRFNLAHELGHLMLDVVEDKAERFTEERACHRFAGAFLAPRPTITDDLGEHRKHLSPVELFVLKRRYGLSMSALIHRAYDLGIIPEAEMQKLYDSFKDLGWNRVEPGEEIPVEVPTRFRLLVLQALAEDLIGRRRATELYKEGPLTTPKEQEALGELAAA